MVSDEPVAWLGTARRDIRDFPEDARGRCGFEIRRAQQGLDPTDWKPMTEVGPGVREIRVRTKLEHRVFYVATFPEAIYILHVFEKRSRKTSLQNCQWAAIVTAPWSRKGGMMRNKDRLRVTPSTGNVFRDVGFSAEESEHLLVRADLLIQLQKAIASRRLTQLKAAAVLGVTQPRVSDLLRGRIDLFSTDSLIDMLARLGVRVRFVLKSSRRRLKVA